MLPLVSVGLQAHLDHLQKHQLCDAVSAHAIMCTQGVYFFILIQLFSVLPDTLL